MDRGWYANEYSATLDSIASRPLSPGEMLSVHRAAYGAAIADDAVRCTEREHVHLVDARIGANMDRVYNGLYGVYQLLMAKNNHISLVFNDRVITDKLSSAEVARFVVERRESEWKQFRADLVREVDVELLGPYKSWSLHKFEATLSREFRACSVLFAAATATASGSQRKESVNRKVNGVEEAESDCKSKSESVDGDTAWQRLSECRDAVKSELLHDAKQWTERIEEMKATLSAEDGARGIRAKAVALEIEDYVRSANEVLTARNEAVSEMKRWAEGLKQPESVQRGTAMVDEVKKMQGDLKRLVLRGKGVMDWKFECLSVNEAALRIKKQFHGKNKRFKKEIKDRINSLKHLDVDDDGSSRRDGGQRIAAMIRFSRHNLEGGTMSILQAMLQNMRSLSLPTNDLGLEPAFDCVSNLEATTAELQKQVDLCRKLLGKLHDFAVRKQRKWTAITKSEGKGGRGGVSDDGDGINGDGVHCDDVIFRNNETGRYEKAFLAVFWTPKLYRVYGSAAAFQEGRAPILEESFRATDYGYNGHLAVEVQRSRTSKKTSSFKGYQFILAKHAFVVEDMLQIKYWRNYIQRGQNMRKMTRDWRANTMSSPQRTAGGMPSPQSINDHSLSVYTPPLCVPAKWPFS